MKNVFVLSFLAIFSSSILPPAFAAEQAAARLNLQPLRLEKDFDGGCGCSVGTGGAANYKTLVFSGVEDRAPALVKVAGELRSLSWISSNEKARAPRVGDRFTKVYSDGKLRLTLALRTTQVCAKNDESCEVTNYKVDAALEQGRDHRVLRALSGDCGC
jgi:hypothetical protein